MKANGCRKKIVPDCVGDAGVYKGNGFEFGKTKTPESVERILENMGESGMAEENKYIDVALEAATMVKEKNEAYGAAFGKSGRVLELLYPDGIPVEGYGGMLTIVRIVDKLFRIATDNDALGEDPMRDILGYALLGVVNTERVEFCGVNGERVLFRGKVGEKRKPAVEGVLESDKELMGSLIAVVEEVEKVIDSQEGYLPDVMPPRVDLTGLKSAMEYVGVKLKKYAAGKKT